MAKTGVKVVNGEIVEEMRVAELRRCSCLNHFSPARCSNNGEIFLRNQEIFPLFYNIVSGNRQRVGLRLIDERDGFRARLALRDIASIVVVAVAAAVVAVVAAAAAAASVPFLDAATASDERNCQSMAMAVRMLRVTKACVED